MHLTVHHERGNDVVRASTLRLSNNTNAAIVIVPTTALDFGAFFGGKVAGIGEVAAMLGWTLSSVSFEQHRN